MVSNVSPFLLTTLDRAIDAGGEGPPGLAPLDPLGGKPPPFITPLEPLDIGGEASCPRFIGFGEYGESVSRLWYLDMPDHSLPPTETGDNGPLRPFIAVNVGENGIFAGIVLPWATLSHVAMQTVVCQARRHNTRSTHCKSVVKAYGSRECKVLDCLSFTETTPADQVVEARFFPLSRSASYAVQLDLDSMVVVWI